jgi:hypothetical protein
MNEFPPFNVSIDVTAELDVQPSIPNQETSQKH